MFIDAAAATLHKQVIHLLVFLQYHNTMISLYRFFGGSILYKISLLTLTSQLLEHATAEYGFPNLLSNVA